MNDDAPTFRKVIKLILDEERTKIRQFYYIEMGKDTADAMDSYIPTESEILKLFTDELI